MAVRAIVQLPTAIRRGEVFEVRLAGDLVFAADLHAAIAANPFVAFPLRVQTGAALELRWTGDRGFVHTESVVLQVT